MTGPCWAAVRRRIALDSTRAELPKEPRPRIDLSVPVVSAWLDLGFELLEPGFVLAGVVPAEKQLSTGTEYGAYLGRCTAAVASVCSGECGAGERRCHWSLPPSRHRSSMPSICRAYSDDRVPNFCRTIAPALRVCVASTVPDVFGPASVPIKLESVSHTITPYVAICGRQRGVGRYLIVSPRHCAVQNPVLQNEPDVPNSTALTSTDPRHAGNSTVRCPAGTHASGMLAP